MADYVTSAELQIELENLAEEIGIGVNQLLDVIRANVQTNTDGISQVNLDIQGIISRLDAIDVIDATDNVETLAEKIKALNDMLSSDGTLATDLLNRVAQNQTAINAVAADLNSEVVRAKAAEQANADAIAAVSAKADSNTTAISNLDTKVNNNKTASDAAIAAVDAKAEGNKADIATINGDETVQGSTDYKIKQAVDAEVARSNAAIAAVDTKATDAGTAAQAAQTTANEAKTLAQAAQGSGDAAATAAQAAQAAADAAQAKADAVGNELDNTQAAIGLNDDGSFTPVDGADTLEEYVQDVQGDANTLKKAIRKVARKSKQADQALAAGVAAQSDRLDVLEGDDTVAGSVRNLIKDVTGGDLTGLSDRVAAEEAESARVKSILDDTTDANGNPVKGLVTKVADNAAAAVAADAKAAAAQAAAVAAMTEAQAAGLVKGVICGRKAANKFLAAVGLPAIAENCPTATGTSTTTSSGTGL